MENIISRERTIIDNAIGYIDKNIEEILKEIEELKMYVSIAKGYTIAYGDIFSCRNHLRSTEFKSSETLDGIYDILSELGEEFADAFLEGIRYKSLRAVFMNQPRRAEAACKSFEILESLNAIKHQLVRLHKAEPIQFKRSILKGMILL